MGEDCMGEHVCEPAEEATRKGQSWDCPECGRAWESFCLLDGPEVTRRILSKHGYDPSVMYGWRP